MADILPLIPMTHRQMALMSDDERAIYWMRVFEWYARADEAAHRLEFQADYHAARHADEWCDT